MKIEQEQNQKQNQEQKLINRNEVFSGENLRSIIDSIPDMIFVIELDGTIISVNRMVLEATGRNPDSDSESPIGRSITILHRPEDHDRALEIFANMVKGKCEICDLPLITLSGKLITVETRFKKCNLNGRSVFVATARDNSMEMRVRDSIIREKNFSVLVLDISARLMNCQTRDIDIEIERALCEIGLFCEASRSYLYLPDSTGKLWSNTHDWCAPKIRSLKDELKNLSTEDYPGWIEKLCHDGFIKFDNPEELPDTYSSIRTLLNKVKVKAILCVPMMRHGDIMAFLGLESSTLNKEWPSNSIEILKVAGEIILAALERRDYEKQLKRSNEKLQLAVTGAGIGLWRLTMETGDFQFNDQWAQMLGYDPASLERNLDGVKSITHPDDFTEVEIAIRQHSSGELPIFRKEIRMKDNEGNWQWVMIAGKMFSDNEHLKPNIMAGIQLDINSTKERERILSDLIASRDIMLSTIAHDLKNPFSALLGMASQLAMKRIPLTETNRIEGACKLIFDSARRCNALLEDLLDWARTKTGAQEARPTPQDLRQVMNGAEELLRGTALEKDICINIDIPIGTIVISDHNMTASIFRNLISNAIKFTLPGGEVKISTRYNGKMVITTIEDNGIGIPRERLRDLFKFERIKSTPGTSGETGTGLGLILCREFAQRNHGSIRMLEKDTAGTTVEVELPGIQ
ncbi:MAG: hypothetical protein CVV64_12575 [Candidatus Wallbacteria bacterium HGW-Wallbacteria-1]|jgi:PAS domain S-box-containing protein|uniref:histidine kinase n=1 Tax=Candidatus Wallbacteria bacterium HGW-Wallbacteria-1 TaxID=2013854 RepID=A0A2N1PN54_9BACT|nr:MAG: hypothetical protein CVV64_12575 [Candidatus Wallbacteria bacterium HGW-Wallbacteria-1]